MSALLIYDIAPIGSIIEWGDGGPRPPERFRKKLSVWKTRNCKGQLAQKQGERTRPNYYSRLNSLSMKAISGLKARSCCRYCEPSPLIVN